MSGLVDRHLDFLVALRAAGVPVSLAEGVDAVAALSTLRWDDRETVRTAYAATVVKRATHRSTFDTLFDLYYPPLVGAGASVDSGPDDAEQGVRDDARARESLPVCRGCDGRRCVATHVGCSSGSRPATGSRDSTRIGRRAAVPNR